MILALVVGLALWRILATRHFAYRPRVITETGGTSTTQESAWSIGTVPNGSAPANQPTPTGAVPTTTPDIPIAVQTEMETVKFFLRDFRAALDGNPVGNNVEITKALMGANPKKTRFVLPGDVRVNAKGELIDHWGTSYFFHALSAHKMEVRSAGADRRLWTGDDIVLR